MKWSASTWLLLCVLVFSITFTSCGGGGGAAAPSTPGAQSPSFAVKPSAITFADQLVNPATTQSQDVIITNSGNANLVISAISLSNTADFSLKNPPAFPVTVVANSSLTVTVLFKPAAPGARSATLSITDNASGSPHPVSLSGRGTAPLVSANSSTLQFGTQGVSNKSAVKTLVLTNTGDGDLVISNISASGDFSYSGTTSMTVGAGRSVPLSVAFTPTVTGARTGSLTITDNASGSSQVIALVGTGVLQGPVQPADASVAISPDSLLSNTFPATVSVTITGTDTNFLQDATVANFGPGAAVLDATSTGVAGAFGTVTVTSPTTATAQLQFDATAAPGPRFVVVMTGNHPSTATFVVPQHDAPEVNAGISQKVTVGSTAHLDGSGSSSQAAAATSAANGKTISNTSNPLLSYEWSLLSAPDGSTTAIADGTAVRPSFNVDMPGTYLVQLAITDNNGRTSANWVLISTDTTVPIADAGPNQFVTAGAKVQLDGSTSSDADGNSLTYLWSFVSVPQGSNAAASLSNPNAPAPTFTPDLAGDYVLKLTVNDGNGNTSSDTVLISTQQTPPTASAGPNQKIQVGQAVQLDGSASLNPDGDPVTCFWALITQPAGSTATLANAGPGACSVKPTLTADQLGTYIAQLTVTDSKNNSATATVVLTTDNPGPAANAGPHQDVNVGDIVQLDGSNSHDGDNSSLTYSWAFLYKPAGSTASLTPVDESNPVFQADVAGDYVAQLIVTDGILISVPSTVRITAASPGFSADHSSLNFGTQTVNTTSDSTPVIITNTGEGTLHISSITITGANAGDFDSTHASLPVAVPAGATTTINVTFTPSAGGSRSATLNIGHDAGAPAAITLSGTGGVPVSQITPSTLTFGNVTVTPPTTSAPQIVTVTNKSTTGGTLTISSISITGTNPGDFAVTPNTPQSLAPNASVQLSVTFKPSLPGGRAATLTIIDNASANAETVALSGTGTAPGISADKNSIAFGDQLIHTTSAPQVVKITNTGTADLHIASLTPSSAEFAASPAAPITIAAGGFANLSLTFSPTSVGNKSESLAIVYDAGTYTISLSGRSIAPDISVPTSPVALPDTLVGSVSSAVPITVTNSGTAPLTIASAVLSDTTNYLIDTVPPGSIAAGNSITLHVNFKPTTRGSHPATLTLTSDALSGPATVNLTGLGLQPGISLNPSPLAFGNQVINTPSSALPITVTNTGNSLLTISALTLGGASPADFTITTGLPVTVAANNGTAAINLVFTPKATGSRAATLTITNDAGAPQVVNLSGTGTQPGIGAPASLTFAAQSVSTTGNSSITITNSGTATLHISALSITTNSAEFAVTTAAPLDIAPGLNANVNLTFTPAQVGNRTGALTITSNAPSSPTAVSLAGVGNAAIIGLNPSPLNFGNQLITVPATSAPASLTITNTGNVNLTISGLSIGGANAADFPFGAGFTQPSQANPITIAANGNTTIPMLFTPGAAGPRTATLSITDNAANSPHSVTLNGTGTQPKQPTFTPTPVTFNQIVGTTSSVVAVTVTNPADATGNLNISAITISGANAGDFATTTVAPINGIIPGGTATINLTFTPGAAGARSGVLSITDNAPGSPHSVNLNGTGAVSNISPTSLTFAGQAIGSTSVAQAVTFAYPAGATGSLTLNSVAVSGANSADFTATATPGTLTAFGQSRQVSVTFAPQAAGGAGSRSATLTINDSTGAYTVALTGTATSPSFSATPSPLSFADTLAKTTSAATPLTITNNGTANLHISSLSITGTNSTEFTVITATPIDIAAGANATVNLTFTPANSGARTATINITDNASGSPHTVTLNGNGIAPLININPSPVAFGNQTVNFTSNPIQVTISNNGTAALTVSAMGLSGANAADFTFSPPAPLNIAAGNNAIVTMTFKPTTAAAETATLTLTDNTVQGVHTVSVTGTGVVPGVSASPSPVQFGNQLLNSPSSPMTVTITNTGLGTLQISDLSISGTNFADFAFPGSFTKPTQLNPITIAPNGTTTVPLIFTPSKTPEGAETATLNITSNASPQAVTLNGTGVAPHFATTPTPTLTFASQLKGTSSAPQIFTITNSGGADLSVSAIAFSGANAGDFAFSPAAPTFPIVVAKNGGTAQLSVIFTPSGSAGETATLTFTDNGVGSPHTLGLSGTSIAPVMGTLAAVNFPNTNVGSTSAAQTLTVTNTGTAPMQITGLSLSGTNAPDFATTTVATPQAPITVAANGGTAQISLTFTPTGPNARSASLVITDNAAGSPHSAALSGTGIPVPSFSPSPTSLSFPNTTVGFASSAMDLTINNPGQADLVISSVARTGSNGPDFSFQGGTTFPQTIPAGQGLVLHVIFQPSIASAESAILRFSDNTPLGQHDVNVSGTGIPPTPNPAYAPDTQLTFTTQQLVRTTSSPASITVTNSGTADMVITGLTLSGANASDFAVVTTPPVTVTKSGGSLNLSLQFTPSDQGTRTATLTIAAKSAFDNSVLPAKTITVSGTGFYRGHFSLNSLSLGKDQEATAIGSLDITSPTPLTVTIASSDPSKVLLVPTAIDPAGTTVGTASFTATIAPGKGRVGDFGFPGFWVQVLGSSGTANITVSAIGYQTGTGVITMTPSGFQLNGPGGAGVNFTSTLGTTTPLTANMVQLDAAGNVLSTSAVLRGGISASVPVISGTTSVGTVTSPAVVSAGASSSAAVTFTPVASGATLLHVTQPSGYNTPAAGTQLTATVITPAISLSPITVGFNQQIVGAGQLNRSSSSALTVNLTSGDASKVLLTTDPAVVGASTINLQVPAGSTTLPAFYVQALANSGVVTLTATASGYSNGTANVALSPSAFILNGPNGTGDFSTSTTSDATNLAIALYQLDSGGRPVSNGGQLRPGRNESVGVTSGTPSSGTILNSPITFHGGDTVNTEMYFLPACSNAPCSTVLSVVEPAGYATPAVGGQINVTVHQPAVTLRMPISTIGQNLEVQATGSLEAATQNGVMVTVTSLDPNNVLLSTSPTAVGSASIQLLILPGNGLNGSGFPQYYVQALGGAGTVQLQASAAGYSSTLTTVTLAPSAFVLAGNNNVGNPFSVPLAQGTQGLTMYAMVLNSSGVPSLVQQVRGGLSPSIPVGSDSPAAAVLGSPFNIAGGGSTTAFTLQLQSLGVANISVAQPVGFTTPSFGGTIQLTVQ